MKKLLMILCIIFCLPANAQELNIILSSEGDGHSANARIFGKYLAKNISPETNVLFKIVPGAAGVNAANYLYNIAPKDGNTIGILFKNIPIIGAIGGPNINFDARNFIWLWSVADGRKDAVVLVSNKPYTGDELVVGAESVVSADPINFIEKYSGLKIKKITGYQSSNSVRLAYERKEIDAFVSSLQGIKTFRKEWLASELFLLQLGNGKIKHLELPNTPTINELIKNEESLKLLTVFESQFALLRPFVAPPGISENKKKELILAFEKAVNDKNYIKEVARINLDIDPIYHDEAQKIVDFTYSASRKILDEIK
jgi:hypothetical protein